MRAPRIGDRVVIDDTSFSSDPNVLPGIPAVVVIAPYFKIHYDGFREWFIHVAIESEVLGGNDYYRKIVEVRIPYNRVTFSG